MKNLFNPILLVRARKKVRVKETLHLPNTKKNGWFTMEVKQNSISWNGTMLSVVFSVNVIFQWYFPKMMIFDAMEPFFPKYHEQNIKHCKHLFG